MKALLIKNGGSIHRTHSLDLLLNEIIKILPGLSEITEDILFVHKFLPQLRYPSGVTVLQEDAEQVCLRFNKINEVFQQALKTNT